jgi:hypothetical protein
MGSHTAKTTNRRDHYLPQGYLRGFIDPARKKQSKPLWCFDLQTNRWRERSPKEIGYIDGFYDFATENTSTEHPDLTFKRLENDFPRIRAQIIQDAFVSWIQYKEFLLAYMQMIRARSPLFFDQWSAHAQTMKVAKVTEVLHDPIKGDGVQHDGFRPMTTAEIQDWTIGQMREEIKKGADWLSNFHWALRYTDSPSDPVITAESPFVSIGTTADVGTALTDPETLLYFPICWQAFLFGSIRRFDIETERFHPATLQNVRRAYRENGRKFLVSPQKLDNL